MEEEEEAWGAWCASTPSPRPPHALGFFPGAGLGASELGALGIPQFLAALLNAGPDVERKLPLQRAVSILQLLPVAPLSICRLLATTTFLFLALAAHDT